MSAIVGLFRRDGAPVSADALASAMTAVAHYGPDGRGCWALGSVSLGHCLLCLTSEPPEAMQPETFADYTIAADARVDNRAELADALGLSAAEEASLSDGGLILRAYERWGERCPELILGDFAFAIWDARRHQLFCARDHAGVRPLYYYATPSLIAFATDIRAVLALPGVRARIDEVEIARCLVSTSRIYFDQARTFFGDLWKLPRAHRLTVSRERIRVSCYWRPEDLPAIELRSVEEYADRAYALVRQAVSDRLPANVRVAAHLSGGLDSSSVAVLATRLLRERGDPTPSVFSWSPAPGDEEAGEHRRIAAICRAENLEPIYSEHNQDPCDPDLVDADIAVRPRVALDIERGVQRAAHRRGVRVMLSGWGGDEGISYNGRGLAAQYLRQRQWRKVAEHMQLADALAGPRRFVSVLSRLWRQGIVPTLPDFLYGRFAYAALRRRRGSPFIHPAFASRIAPTLTGEVRLREIPDSRAFQLMLWHHGHLANRMESWASFGADYGLVYAYPLTDRRVLEFAYGVPTELFHMNGHSRYLYRRAAARILPQDVSWGSVKHDAALNLRVMQWIVPPLERERAARRLCSPSPWISSERLRRALGSGPVRLVDEYCSTRHALECLAIWHRWQATS